MDQNQVKQIAYKVNLYNIQTPKYKQKQTIYLGFTITSCKILSTNEDTTSCPIQPRTLLFLSFKIW
jgi:hypothetical protein